MIGHSLVPVCNTVDRRHSNGSDILVYKVQNRYHVGSSGIMVSHVGNCTYSLIEQRPYEPFRSSSESRHRLQNKPRLYLDANQEIVRYVQGERMLTGNLLCKMNSDQVAVMVMLRGATYLRLRRVRAKLSNRLSRDVCPQGCRTKNSRQLTVAFRCQIGLIAGGEFPWK